MTLEASWTFSSSESPEGLLSLSISARFSASAAAAALVSLSAFSASFSAACFWISFAVGSRSSIFTGMGLSSPSATFSASHPEGGGNGAFDSNQAFSRSRPAASPWTGLHGTDLDRGIGTRCREEEWNASEPKKRLGGNHAVGGDPGPVRAGESDRPHRCLGDQRGGMQERVPAERQGEPDHVRADVRGPWRWLYRRTEPADWTHCKMRHQDEKGRWSDGEYSCKLRHRHHALPCPIHFEGG